MGFMTLEDFEAEVQATMGNRGLDNSRLDEWINLGYFDLTGAISFESLNSLETANTIIGTPTYAVPDGAVVVKAVTLSKSLLRWVPQNEYLRLNRVTNGVPKKWTRIADSIYLQPTPSAVSPLEFLIKSEPAALAAAADVTVLPKTWDAAVLFLAIHHGFMAVGEENRAIPWLNRAVSYAASRITDDMIENTTSGMGATIGNSTFKNALMQQFASQQAGA